MAANPKTRAILQVTCLLIIGVYAWMINLKGITTDEGFRLWIINGGHPASVLGPSPEASWPNVIAANSPYAYQPLYFLIQNTLMRLFHSQSLTLFRCTNLVCLWFALQGLLMISRDWRFVSRLFLLGLFSFNAYLFMHVLQIREYIAGVAFYIWTSWLVLHLDARKLEHPWRDTAWFAVYGVILALGFYLQSWTVFPAAAQGLFLILRRSGDRLRHCAHLALSYVVVVTTTLPYLQSNRQKIDVGLWASEHASIPAHLYTGFHLLLSGHMPGVSRWADGLFWFWLIFLVGGLVWLLVMKSPSVDLPSRRETRRQVLLILLCLGVSVAFQVGYALKVENLSLWPRYFVIHYFFLVWLGALVFQRLYALGASPGKLRRGHLTTGAVAAVMGAVMVISSVFQVISYRRDPMLDTSQSIVSNWTVWSADLARILHPGDVVLMDHFIGRATLTFSRPIPNRVILPDDLVSSSLSANARIVYLEARENRSKRNDFAAKAAAAGFERIHEQPVLATDGHTVLPECTLVIFSRS